MIETSDDLAQHVRRNLIPSNAITGLKVIENHGFISFRWYERDFVVKKSLEVFEVKNQNLFVTGASMLMQFVLMGAEREGKVADALVTSIRQLEDLVGDDQQRETSFKLLESVKAALKRLTNSWGARPAPEPPRAADPHQRDILPNVPNRTHSVSRN